MNILHLLSFEPADRAAVPVPAGASKARRRGDRRALRFDTAMTLMEAGHWEQAYACLAELADAGHPQAARIALLYVQRGALLFGGRYAASAQQRERWQRAGH
jgi:hypothetical protein